MSGQKWHLERKFDPRLHKDLPGILSKTDVDVILELTCNSYDADSTRVDVNYDPEEKYLSISDDGEGMGTERKLQKFFTRGGSDKATERRTRKGRLKIGKFSLAASLVYYLTGRYRLETSSDGNHVILEEDFQETEGEEYVPDPKVEEIDKNHHGTKIEFLELKRQLNLEELVYRAARELPITQDDFVLSINGERVHPPKIDDASIFYIDEQIPGVGKIYGEIYLSENKIRGYGGIYLKVHGRAVGDPMAPFNLSKGQTKIKARPGSALGMAKRVIGFLYADGLDPFISFDRSGFKEDHQEVIAVQEAIIRQLSVMRRYYDAAVGEEKRRSKLSKYLDVVNSVERRFNRADKEFLPRGTCRFELTKEEGYLPVDIDLEGNRVIVNTAHPYFIGMRNPPALETSLIAAVAFAMARKRLETKGLVKEFGRMDGAFRKGFEVFHPQGKRLVEILFGTEEVSALDQPDVIEPSRLYRLEELAELTKLDDATVRELIDCGLFEEPTRRPILSHPDIRHIGGKSVRDTFKQIENHKLLVQIVREAFPQLTTEEHLEYVDDLTYSLLKEGDSVDYARDIGILKPFFIIPNERAELFSVYLSTHGAIGVKRLSYSVVVKDHRYLFLFSIRVPRVHRDNPEEFYKEQAGFLDEYLSRDIGGRVIAHYLQDQHRIVGSVLSFEQAVLRRTFDDHRFSHKNSAPNEIFLYEFPQLRASRAGQNSFNILEETPEIYRELLVK